MNTPSAITMPLRSIIFIFLFILPIQSGIVISGNEADTVIINKLAGPPDTSKDALVNYMSFRDISDWASSFKMTVLEDSPPYVDGTAFFIMHPHIELPVTGLIKGARYYLYIDFVKYRNSRINVASFLKIYIQDIYGKKTLISRYSFSSLFADEKFVAEIPFNLSNPGSFTIIIQEYSDKTGYWGIWDIIVSSKKLEDILPAGSDTRPELRETDPKIFR